MQITTRNDGTTLATINDIAHVSIEDGVLSIEDSCGSGIDFQCGLERIQEVLAEAPSMFDRGVDYSVADDLRAMLAEQTVLRQQSRVG